MNDKKPITASRSIVTSTLVSVGDILLNLIVAAITGSTVMLAQALQGTADLVTALLLLVGVRRARRAPSKSHPFGYGREVFFWTLLASIFTFLITAGLAIASGMSQILTPEPPESIWLAFVMLSFGLVTNAYAFSVSLRRLTSGLAGRKLLRHILDSSLIETKTSLLVDFMGTFSAFIGLIALGLFQLTNNAFFDGLGAVAVGVLTALGSGMLIYNLRGLIIGKSPPQQIVESIRESALEVEGVREVLDLRATVIGSGKVLVILEVHFNDDMRADDIEAATDRIKESVIINNQSVTQVQVEAETPDEELKKRN